MYIYVIIFDTSTLFYNNSWSSDLDFQWYVTFPDTGVTATPRLWVQSLVAMSVEEPAPKRRRLRKAPSGGKEGCYHMSKNQKPELFRVYRGSHGIHVW